MTRLLTLFLLLPAIARAAGLGVYNPAQHAVNGFMPTQLPDIQLWLDANKIGLTNGASVDVWQDFSGKSNWATNGTGSKRPLVSAINGRTALSFDGVDDWLAISNFRCQTHVSVFVALKMTSATSKHFFFEHGPDVNTSPGFFFFGTEFSAWAFLRQTTNFAKGVKDWNTNTPIVASMTYDGSGQYARNGIVLDNSTITGAAVTNTSVTNALNIFARNGGAGVFSQGVLCELIICTNKVSKEMELNVQRYLGTKYGIVVQ